MPRGKIFPERMALLGNGTVGLIGQRPGLKKRVFNLTCLRQPLRPSTAVGTAGTREQQPWISSMRKPIATLIISGVIFATGSTTSTPSVFAQGFLKRLQERVQSLDQQSGGDQNPAARGPVEDSPRVGGQRTNQRRPLVDTLFQYGPQLFGGQESSNPASIGSDINRGSGRGMPARTTRQLKSASLGIDVLESPPGVPGVLVTGFRSDSKADDAGLQKNDVIVSLDQTLTPKIADIARFLSLRRAGESVSARVLRGDQMKTIRIPLLGPQPPSLAWNRQSGASLPVPPLPKPPAPKSPAKPRHVIGTVPVAGPVEILPAPLTRPAAQLSNNAGVEQYGILLNAESLLRGARVEGVVKGSVADFSGIKPADRVVSVDGVLTRDNTALVRQFDGVTLGTIVSLGVVRGDSYVIKRMELTTEIKSGTAAVERPLNASEKPRSADGKEIETESGVLEGIGSVLGGLLGGADKERNEGQFEDGPFEAVPQERKEGPKASESVRQTSFEQNSSGQLNKMLGDPPSLDGLSVKPKADSTPSTTDSETPGQTAADMREQIRLLQEKLKQIEQRSQNDHKAVQQETPKTKKSE